MTQKSKPHKQGDPLLGEVNPRGTKFDPAHGLPAGMAHNNNGPGATQTSGLSETPPVYAPTSPAYLASLQKGLPGSNPLAIPNGNVASQPGSPWNTDGQGGKIQALPPSSGWVGANPNAQTTTQPTSKTNFASDADPLQEQLRRRGVVSQQLTSIPGGVQLNVVIPNRQNANMLRGYEATARDYTSAVQAVLVQIDSQR